jgi:hypothetical protein
MSCTGHAPPLQKFLQSGMNWYLPAPQTGSFAPMELAQQT